MITIREENRTKRKTELCKVESFDRKGLVKVNSQNLVMSCKIGSVENEFNLTAKLRLDEKEVFR